MNSLTKAFACCATLLAGEAQAQDHAGGHASGSAMQQMSPNMVPAAADPQSVKEFKQADMTMMKNMDVAYTGKPDVDFRTHMIPHHQGAIDMAKVALKHTKSADTKLMAQKIIDDQEKEIADMQAWLKQHGGK